ncbi:hypothetical protein DFH07DRAFT_772044 [Mycena maculata]|uniref:Uncharacterized protein n=1 Tax=Mycena maculata TaxID=230809 RepID=A0AAD7JAH0_9AGAR|nr:hypothetical protein DFH07DRAFT_772044 [Mycena maculata]
MNDCQQIASDSPSNAAAISEIAKVSASVPSVGSREVRAGHGAVSTLVIVSMCQTRRDQVEYSPSRTLTSRPPDQIEQGERVLRTKCPPPSDDEAGDSVGRSETSARARRARRRPVAPLLLQRVVSRPLPATRRRSYSHVKVLENAPQSLDTLDSFITVRWHLSRALDPPAQLSAHRVGEFTRGHNAKRLSQQDSRDVQETGNPMMTIEKEGGKSSPV